MNQVLGVQQMGAAIAKNARKLFISVGATVLRRWGACLFEIVESQVFADCLSNFPSVERCIDSIAPENARDWQRLTGYQEARMRRARCERAKKAGIRKALGSVLPPFGPLPLERKLRDSKRSIEPLLMRYVSRHSDTGMSEIRGIYDEWQALRTCTAVCMILGVALCFLGVLLYELRILQSNPIIHNLSPIAFVVELVFLVCGQSARGTYREYCSYLLSEVSVSFNVPR
ncbi:hypothetical protein [Granulicella sp. S156]|uniref:hypothetical protein n=1 Tax=Granulicella sp. S156 TaxID=1747224 RepID=UPI00131CE8E5|nr:hypothetical protein [Granulicella sp. S156]